MKFAKFLLLSIAFSTSLLAQETKLTRFFSVSDTLNKSRLKTVSYTQAGIWVNTMVLLNQEWYANYPRSAFHFFNDNGEWNHVDKFGHAWSAYWGAQFSSGLFTWAGVSRKRAAIYGAGMGVAYESVIEILDGFSAEWGFSLGDMAANVSGSALFAAQEVAWGEQRIQYKFSAHKIYYDDPILLRKANQLYGKSLAERILKDYNGQTYWLSANIWSFAKQSKFPKWLNISVGYGAAGMFGGYTNDWTDEETGVYYNRNDIKRISQFYLAPDIDLSKIQIRGKNPKLFKMLSGLKLKFPMPTLELNSTHGVKFHTLFF